MNLQTLFVAAIGVTLSGCAAVADRVGPTLAKGVHRYCTELAPDERAIVRRHVNRQIRPHSARVTCAGDEEE